MHAEWGSRYATPATVLAMPTLTMARFRRLMRYEGHDVDLPRMCLDADYAYDRLAVAHTSDDERLRRIALELFDTYQRNAEAEFVLH